MPDNYGVFEKNGQERLAVTPADAVQLRFAGWTEKKQEAPKPTPTTENTTRVMDAKKTP